MSCGLLPQKVVLEMAGVELDDPALKMPPPEKPARTVFSSSGLTASVLHLAPTLAGPCSVQALTLPAQSVILASYVAVVWMEARAFFHPRQSKLLSGKDR